jgi:mRNA interferase MazF
MDVVNTRRFSVFLVNLDPTLGSEMKKTRPCVVVSPDEMNRHLSTVIIAPLTSTLRGYASRVSCVFDSKSGEIALDQIRAVDKNRLIKMMGKIQDSECQQVLSVLQDMFTR